MQSKMNGRKLLMTDSQTEESLMTNLSWTSDFGKSFEAGGDDQEPEDRQTDMFSRWSQDRASHTQKAFS